MKAILRVLPILLCLSLVLSSAFGGTDPTNEQQVFQIQSIHLAPDTFIVTLVINTPRADWFYGVLAHDGPEASNATWQVIGEQPGTGSTATFLDDVSGSLTHTGRSYRGFVSDVPNPSPPERVLTKSEEFIPYPFMSAPTISLNPTSSPIDQLVFTYGESIYTNNVTWNIPGDSSSAIFRMYTADGDPSNAVIQISPALQEGSWSNLSE